MSLIRIVPRGLAMATLFTAATLSCRAGQAVLRGERWLAWKRGTLSGLAGPLLLALGGRVRIEGELPPAPCLLLVNHLSYVDILVLGRVLAPVFVSRDDVVGWPLVGSLSRVADTVFLDRDRRLDVKRVSAEIQAALDRGERVVLFAEGTTSPGHTIRPFQPALLGPALRSGAPLHVATLHYGTPPGAEAAHEAVAWWGGRGFAEHVRGLLSLPRWQARVRFSPAPVQGATRKELALRAHEQALAGFEPLVQTEELDAQRLAADEPEWLRGRQRG